MVTMVVVALLFGYLAWKSDEDWFSTILLSLFGGFVIGGFLAVIISALLPTRTVLVTSLPLEKMNVGEGLYNLQMIDDEDYFVYTSNGKVIVVADGNREVKYEPVAKPYVELYETSIDFSRVPRWLMLFGFDKLTYTPKSTIFYVPEDKVFYVP